jgi:cell division protein FtsW
MPGAAARRARPSGASDARSDRKRVKGSAVTHKAQPLEHRILLTATLCLLAFGAVMVYSASSPRSLLQGQGNGSGYLIKFVVYGALGLLLMRLLARDGISRVQGIVGPLLAVSFLLVVAVHIPHVGVSVNGARRWIGPGMFQFQPSELMKLALVLYTATLLAKRPQRVHDLRQLARPLLVVVAGALLLVASQPDIGTAMVIAFSISSLLIAAGMPMRKLGSLAAVAVAVVMLYAIVQPYSRARLTSFLNPWAHASSTGFQAVQGQIAIGSGGVFGAGPGQSVQKVFYLPEAQTDFILAVIGEELGVVGVCALLFLYGLIAYAGLRAAKAARSLYGSLMAVGITSLILCQALLNVFAVLGLAPLTGVPLPFVSYGSSSLVVMLAAMGLLLNVASGGTAHIRAVGSREGRRSGQKPAVRRGADVAPRKSARLGNGSSPEEDRDRRRRHRRARGAGTGGSRRAAG